MCRRLFVALVLVPLCAAGHNEHPLGRQVLEWSGGPEILRTLALNFDFHSGANFITYRPHGEVQMRDGRECLVGPYFLFDIDDRFAFDIDEEVTLELVFDARISTGFNLSWDHAVSPAALSATFEPAAETPWVTHRITLPRARFANRKYEKTDFSIGAPNSKFPPGDYKAGHEVALCGITVLRTATSAAPVATAVGLLELNVVDEAGQPAAVRVGLYDREGRAPLPSADALTLRRFGEQVRQIALRQVPAAWPGAGRYVFYVDGVYTSELPVGHYTLVLSKGPEFRLLTREFEIHEGLATELNLVLERWRDLPAAGWYSGDDHIHIARHDPAGNDAILAYSRAEDIHVANLLQMGNVTTSHFPQYAFGSRGQHRNGTHALVSGQESPRTSHRGHTIGLNGHRFHWPVNDYYLYDRTAAAIHADGGLFGYAHVALDAFNVAWGLALDVPLGQVDFVEMLQMGRLNTRYLYDFLNLGFRLLPAAGSDYPYIHVAGAERIYVSLDTAFSVDAWFAAWRNRRSQVSNAPIIEFTVNGDAASTTIDLAAGAAVDVRADAAVNPDFDALATLELVHQGTVIAAGTTTLEHRFTPPHSGWIALRATGHGGTVAHTAPVFLQVAGSRGFHDRETAPELARHYHRLLQGLRDSSPDLDHEWERFNVEHDVLPRWHDDKAALDQRIEQAQQIYEAITDGAPAPSPRP